MKPPKPNLKLIVPDNIREIFGERPLVMGEPPGAYDALLSTVAVTFVPRDVIDWLFVKDFVDMAWATKRLRRFQVSSINTACQKAFFDSAFATLDNAHGEKQDELKEIERRLLYGDKGQKLQALAEMEKNWIDEESIMTKALDQRLEEYETIECLLAALESRRNRTIREIERRRGATELQRGKTRHGVGGDVPQPGKTQTFPFAKQLVNEQPSSVIVSS